jgi:HEAT repeat protein
MAVLDELFSGDDERAAAAVQQVSEAELPALLEALGGREPDARWWAACALAYVPGPAATAALVQAAADADALLRAAVVHALGLRRDLDGVPPLLLALGDPSDYLARLASDALIQMGPAAVPDLTAVVANDTRARVRANAARALALIGDPGALPALFRALKDSSILVQHWAEEGLERLGAGQVYFGL